MIPWGAYYRQLSCAVPTREWRLPGRQVSALRPIGEMLVFIAILLVGYVYVWKKGALQWD